MPRNFSQSEEALLTEEPSRVFLANQDSGMQGKWKPWMNPPVWVIKYLAADWLMSGLLKLASVTASEGTEYLGANPAYWGLSTVQSYFI